jgi:hypothetical protein
VRDVHLPDPTSAGNRRAFYAAMSGRLACLVVSRAETLSSQHGHSFVAS